MTRYLFISTMNGYSWGGSEELWARTAAELVKRGAKVSASVHGWTPEHARVLELERSGVDVRRRRPYYSALRRAANRVAGRSRPPHVEDYKRWLEESEPALVVISNGNTFPPTDLAELCIELSLPFVTIAQANYEDWWPDDDLAQRYRAVMSAAVRCYFVSEGNWRLAEKQIGCRLPNAEVVRNPFNVPYDVVPTWPTEEGSQLRMACVARLHAPSKGQDLLFEALAEPPWTDRDWRLSLYGEGPNQALLEWFAEQLGLDKRIEFKGQVNDVAGIWAKHHLLVLPSRYEGLPLVLVEAMLCGRPAVVTDVAGNCEVVAAGVSGFVAEAPSKPALRRALEQAWEHRGELRTMGEAAAVRVRELTPRDPVGAFVDKLQALAGFASAPSHSRRAGALST